MSTPSQSEFLISSASRGFFSVSATCSSNSMSAQSLSIFSASALPSSSPIILRLSTRPMPLPLSVESIRPFSLSVKRFTSLASPLFFASASSARAFVICSSLNSSAAFRIPSKGFALGSLPSPTGLAPSDFSPGCSPGSVRPSEASEGLSLFSSTSALSTSRCPSVGSLPPRACGSVPSELPASPFPSLLECLVS